MQKKQTVSIVLATLISMIVTASIGLNFLLLNELQELRNEWDLKSQELTTESPVLKEFLASREIFNDRTNSLIREPDAVMADLNAMLALEQLP